jgi:hypothetical protein
MKSLAFFAAAAIILASCNAGSASSGNNTTNTVAPAEQALATKPKIINSQEAKLLLTKQQNIVLLDVRTPDEYNAGATLNMLHTLIFTVLILNNAWRLWTAQKLMWFIVPWEAEARKQYN